MKLLVLFSTLALFACFTVAIARQDQPPGKNDGKDQREADDGGKDVVARVAKDMQLAEQRLKKIDPGDVTRKIQREIIDGLDALIKQNSKSESGGGGGAGQSAKMQQGGGQRRNVGAKGSSNAQKSGPQEQADPKNGDNAEEMDQPGRAKGGKDGAKQSEAKDKGKGKGEQKGGGKDKENAKNDAEGSGKDAGKNKDGDAKEGQAKGNEPGKNQGKEGGLGIVKNYTPPKTKSNLAADTYRTDWGHLPLTKRLEMDAYSRERFMPRYDEVLQQYYRTIAEQGQKKDQ